MSRTIALGSDYIFYHFLVSDSWTQSVPGPHLRSFVAFILSHSRSEIFHVVAELWSERKRTIFPPVVDTWKIHQVREAQPILFAPSSMSARANGDEWVLSGYSS